MSDTLRLARSLGALGDDALAALLQTREVAGAAPRDFFDLADALLDAGSIASALRPFDRATLKWLAAGAAAPASPPLPPRSTPVAELTALGLVGSPAATDARVHVYSAVRDVAARVLAAAPPSGASTAATIGPDAVGDAASEPTGSPDAYGPDATTPSGQRGVAGAGAEATGSTDARGGPQTPRPDVEPRPADAEAGPTKVTDARSGSTASVDLAAGERAFGALVAVSELGHQARLAALRVKARGGVPVAEEKRLAPLLAVEPEEVAIVVDLALAAGLLGEDGDRLLSTEALDEWHRLAPERRWLRLVSAWMGTLSRPVRRTVEWSGPAWPGPLRAASAFRELHPAADDAMVAALSEVDAVAAFLGLVVGEESSAFGAAALASHAAGQGPDAAAAAIAPLFPAEVDRVYVQHDLSVIAPGPLSPALDARLRRLAPLENRGVASSYRITAQSIDRALAEGETAEGAREFLAELSLTGIPQSLDYLLTQGDRRHGLLRVLPAPATGTTPGPRSAPLTPGDAVPARALIRTTDPALADSLAVDQSLAALALRRTPDGDLTSRATPSTVFWALADARYPALVEDEHGERLLLHRVPVLPAPPVPGEHDRRADDHADPITPSPPPASIADLIRRLRAAPASALDDDTAWMVRQIDQAIRSRSPLRIEVRFPDDSVRDVEVTPLSVANGRLRCLDLRAGVERTVPVANIVALTPVSPGADVD
ncbi:helicase-associated domain-containing protein [Herbiconiux sp. A18JL235]|uniref:Helicase-associated domain-containing protein n=1 Tax=Herbiconiux sp. A18JL235 TaxID=3152363 RepID=A0AB39BF30_9MICO